MNRGNQLLCVFVPNVLGSVYSCAVASEDEHVYDSFFLFVWFVLFSRGLLQMQCHVKHLATAAGILYFTAQGKV